LKHSRSKDIATIYQQALAQRLAFAAFRLPNTEEIQCITGAVSRNIETHESAFAFVPFSPYQKPYYIKTENKKPDIRHELVLQKSSKQKSTSKKQYADLVNKIIAKVIAGDCKKIVAARVLALHKPDSFSPASFFEELCRRYQSAFVSLVYIPRIGLWIGASPEVLISETSTELTIYSLAGTKAIDDTTAWTEKEKKEQEIVTGFISKQLRMTFPEKITIEGPRTQEAGTIKHLLSVFTVNYRNKGMWKQVADIIHPTPAVAGVSQYKAVKFIKEEESFDRTFYAGYLGPVNMADKTDLFVNLRCMQVTNTQLLLYAGCGVTAGSDPEKEWQESERKIDILRSLI
jgi:isochorismate synthase